MATTGLGTLVAGIKNIANLKCCCPACCRWCLDSNICVSYTAADDGVWDCSTSGPTGAQSVTAAVLAGATYCDGGTHYDTATWQHTFFLSAPGFGTFSREVTVSLTKDPETGLCTVTVTITVACSGSSSGYPLGSSVTYVGSYTLPTVTSGCFDYSEGLEITADITEYVHLDPTETQPSTLTVTIMPGPCVAPMSAMRAAAPATRTTLCTSLGERTEFRAGCDSGWMCRHKCNSTDPIVLVALGGVLEAVPGDDCQTCPGYVPRPSQS